MKRMTVECACERGGDCTKTTACAVDSALQDQADMYDIRIVELEAQVYAADVSVADLVTLNKRQEADRVAIARIRDKKASKARRRIAELKALLVSGKALMQEHADRITELENRE